MKRTFSLVTAIGAVALAAWPAAPSLAQTPPATLTPTNAAWGMVFDPAKVRASALAGHVMDHFDENQRASLDEKIDGLSNMFGLNLRQDLGQIVAFGDSFAPADIAVAVDVGPAQTNLEGLLLANENYQSYDYGDLIIHSIQDPDQPRLFCAVLPGSEAKPGVLVLSPGQALAEQLVDEVQAGARVVDPAALDGADFFRLWIDRLPDDLFAGQPRQSNVAGMIQSIEIVGSTNAADTAFALNLTLTNPARARQIYQMAAGGKALIELAASSDPDAAKLADLLAYVRVEQPQDNSNRLNITALCDTAGLASVLDMLDEAGAFEDLGLE